MKNSRHSSHPERPASDSIYGSSVIAAIVLRMNIRQTVKIPRIRHSPLERISVPCEAFRVDTVLPRPQGVMKSSDVEKLISKMDPAVSKIYYDAKHVLETVEGSESEEFLAAARIVKIFWNKALRQINRLGSNS